MSILSGTAIHVAYKLGEVEIDPFDDRQIGPNSYDVRLGSWYYTQQDGGELFVPIDAESVRAFWGKPQNAGKNGVILFPPGETVLAHTEEYIGAYTAYTTKMYSRSSIARACLDVCRSAGFGDVGYCGRWTMEITNHSTIPIVLPVGIRVAQIAFIRVEGADTTYAGKYGKIPSQWKPDDMLPKLWQDTDCYGRLPVREAPRG